MFLALKAENNLVPIDHFISRFSKLSADEVLSNEFLIAQSLGFEFKVHHSHIALHGLFLDLQSLPDLPPSPPLASLLTSASHTLSTLALPLDLPLLYTPSQIALGTIHFHSPEHITAYLEHKETVSAGKLTAATVLAVVEEIVEELRAEETRLGEDVGGKKRLGRVKEVDRRLRSCGNPEKVAGTALYVSVFLLVAIGYPVARPASLTCHLSLSLKLPQTATRGGGRGVCEASQEGCQDEGGPEEGRGHLWRRPRHYPAD